MTNETIDLGRRWVATGLGWAGGMLTLRHSDVFEFQPKRLVRWERREDGIFPHDDGEEPEEYHRAVWLGIAYSAGGCSGLTVYVDDETTIPNLSDRPTQGAALGLIEDRVGKVCHLVYAVARWAVWVHHSEVSYSRLGSGATRAEALVDAAEAVAGGAS